MEQNIVLYKVHGNSMYPAIRNEDAILVERNLKDRVGIGDIVLYRNGFSEEGKFTVHRVVLRKKSAFLTKGDNVEGCTWINKVDIVGKIRYVYRKNKEIRCESFSKALYFVIKGIFVIVMNRLRRVYG